MNMKPKWDINSYDMTRFKYELGTAYGYRVGDELAVAVSNPLNYTAKTKWRIYNRHSGLEVVHLDFQTKEDAIAFAEFIEEQMREYLPILREYFDADIATLVQYTIPNGLAINAFIKSLEQAVGKAWSMVEVLALAKQAT